VIPAPFDYVRPGTVDEAVAALQQAGEDAKILAGGQSLIPVLRLRLAAPSMLIDLGGIPELRRIRDDGDRIAIGAMAPHHEVMRDELVKEHVGLLAQATATVADNQVRHRGTLGGALAHADPAGDLGGVALALEAEFVITGPGGQRTSTSNTARRSGRPSGVGPLACVVHTPAGVVARKCSATSSLNPGPESKPVAGPSCCGGTCSVMSSPPGSERTLQ